MNCPHCGQHLCDSKPDPFRLPDRFPFTPQQQVLYEALVRATKRGGAAQHTALADALWGRRADGGPETSLQIIKTQISHMRRKLSPYKIRIKNSYAHGYWLETNT